MYIAAADCCKLAFADGAWPDFRWMQCGGWTSISIWSRSPACTLTCYYCIDMYYVLILYLRWHAQCAWQNSIVSHVNVASALQKKRFVWWQPHNHACDESFTGLLAGLDSFHICSVFFVPLAGSRRMVDKCTLGRQPLHDWGGWSYLLIRYRYRYAENSQSAAHSDMFS